MRRHSPPFCSIVPPYLLEEIARRGDAADREAALQSLTASGRLRGHREALALLPGAVPTGQKRRAVYDAKHSSRLPGQLVRGERDPATGDPAVDEAYDGAGATYDCYFDVYHRRSIDDRGMRLESTVHYGRAFNNAFWDGRQMVYGDGDGRIFQRFTRCVDVIAHELAHGVTAHTANLAYEDEAGALNESMSDVFGSLVKQRSLNHDAKAADWLIGEGLFAPGIKGQALRSMRAPGTAYDDPRLGKDPQPATMNGYVHTSDDNGGVHVNSGIPNHAFFRLAVALGGYAWEKAGLIWYDALTRQLRPRSDFQEGADATLAAATLRFGPGSLEEQAVRRAWLDVGIAARTHALTQQPVVKVRRGTEAGDAPGSQGARREKMADL
jgi:Zn-dependent metalloprotease